MRDPAAADELRHPPAPGPDITGLLREARDGSPDAVDRLLEAIYGDLLRVARGLLRGERPGHTLDSVALVNEAIMRLDLTSPEPQNRRELFARAWRVMTQVLVDHARRRGAKKRGGAGRVSLDIHSVSVAIETTLEIDVIDLDEALARLRDWDPRKHEVVMLKFFFGLPHADIAELLEYSAKSVERDWRLARAHLYRHLREDQA